MELDELNKDFRFYAAKGNLDQVKNCLSRGADIDAIGCPYDADYYYDEYLGEAAALHYAAYYGRTTVVEFLLKYGADASLLSEKFITALQAAEHRGHRVTADTIQEFLEKQAEHRGHRVTADSIQEYLEKQALQNKYFQAKVQELQGKIVQAELLQQQNAQALVMAQNENEHLRAKVQELQGKIDQAVPPQEQNAKVGFENFLEEHTLSSFKDFFDQSHGIIQVDDFESLNGTDWLDITQKIKKGNAFRLKKALKALGVVVHDEIPLQPDNKSQKALVTGCEFLAFLSHYKKEAGADARSLKLHIIYYLQDKGYNISTADVYLDSDSLRDLDVLLPSVQCSRYLIVLLTFKVLTRPWCLLEIVTAYKANICFIPVLLSQEKHFNLDLLECYKTDLKQGIVKNLTDDGTEDDASAALKADECVGKIIEHGFSVNEVQEAIARLQQVIAIPLNLHSDSESRIDGSLRDITAIMIKECTVSK